MKTVFCQYLNNSQAFQTCNKCTRFQLMAWNTFTQLELIKMYKYQNRNIRLRNQSFNYK